MLRVVLRVLPQGFPCRIVRTGWRNALSRLSSSSTHHEIRGTIPPGGVGVALDQYAEVERVFTQEDVDNYAELIDDMNPLHQRWIKSKVPSLVESHPLLVWNDDGSSTMPIAHGMLVSGLFSCIFGSLIPGAVYLKQTLAFRKPVYVDSVVIGRVTISAIRQWKRKGLIITCDTKVLSQGKECVRGEADVLIPGGDELISDIKD
jgi:acyl dehydratase